MNIWAQLSQNERWKVFAQFQSADKPVQMKYQHYRKKWLVQCNCSMIWKFIYQLQFWQIISAAGVCRINSAEFLLTVDRVVVASNSRNIIIVIVRNVPHPALPDGPARGRRQGGADDDGEDQELKERPSCWWSEENISYRNENLHLTDIFRLIQGERRSSIYIDLGLAYYHIYWQLYTEITNRT